MHLSIFQQSVFLQSLGWAIVNNIWQAGVLWVLFHFTVLSYSTASARFKNTSGTIFLFITFLWFIITLFNRLIFLQNNISDNQTIGKPFLYSVHSPGEGFHLPGFFSYFAVTLPYLSAAYLILLVILTIKLINTYRNTNVIKHYGLQKPPAQWTLFVENVARQIVIPKKVKLWLSVYVDVPATIGFLKPIILIPVASLNQLTTNQLEAIILHELAHIKRHDYLINMVISLIETILFFNPFISLLSKIIKKERENCCDDFVLQYQYDPHSYASALLCLEKHRRQNFRLALAATSGKKQLLLRIKRIIDADNRSAHLNYGQKLLALLALTGIICSIAWLSPVRKVTPGIAGKQITSSTPENVNPKIAREPGKPVAKFYKDQKKISLSIAKLRVPKDKPVDINPVLSLLRHSENSFSFNIGDQETTHSPKIDKQHGFIEDPKEQNQWQAFENNLVPSPDKGPSTDLLNDEDPLLNLSFDVDLSRLSAEIQKNSVGLSLLNWDKITKEIGKGFENFKIPHIKINIQNHQNINSNVKKGTLQESAIKENKLQKDLQLLLIRNNKNIEKLDVNHIADQLRGNKTIDLLINNIRSNRDNNNKISPAQEGNTTFFYSSPDQKTNEVILVAPHQPHYNGQNDVTYSFREKMPATGSVKNSRNARSIQINGKKIKIPDTMESPEATFPKKLLMLLDKKMTVLNVED